MRRISTLAAALGVLTLVLAACGNDDDVTFDAAAFCEIADELDSGDGPPTAEQVERYVEAAPDEIRADARFVADAFIEHEGNIGAIFSDPEVGERIENLEAAEAEHCGRELDNGDDPPEGDTEPAEGAGVVEVTGVEYAFEGVPASLEAGLIAFAFTNGGEEAHEMSIGKLAEGVSVADVIAFDGDPFDAGMVTDFVGITFGTPGSDTTYVNAELDAGTYGMVCFIPGPGGQSHAELGMVAEFTVA